MAGGSSQNKSFQDQQAVKGGIPAGALGLGWEVMQRRVWVEGGAGKAFPVHGVGLGHPTGRPVLAVEAILQVDLGLPDEVVGAHQVPVVHSHGQHGLHGEGGLDVEGSGIGGSREKLLEGLAATQDKPVVCPPWGRWVCSSPWMVFNLHPPLQDI